MVRRVDAFCYHCGADFSDVANGEASEEELDRLADDPDVDLGNLHEGCCPCCGFEYHPDDEDDNLFVYG
jgi:hypothetical protein